ncbi:AraC family transcriptional regulator [Gordoniibacillus kamchatkensis]|uniref:AraC family transcriptional regulator n=1 Tax=Gordoniibacillus kamchatkensis TaxID=1590651 RepID=A0ABR5AEJ4_9BACL|nr:AraC family transcriptional regulator [Paenibacillus sp. VKM B-2647]KIL39307.1 AraC family transcriptional regulator [Paenibacillus sp. VKM B-2647]
MERFSLYRPELLDGDYHPRFEAYYYRQWDGFKMPYHAHDRAEIMYVISGSCEVHTEREAIALRKGEFIVLDAGVPHRLLVGQDQPCRMLNVEFVFVREACSFPALRQLAEGDPALAAFLREAQPVLVLRDPSDVQHALRSLVLHLDSREPGRELMVRLLFAQLLLQTARLAAEARESGQEASERYVRQAIRYMHQHYDCGLQVKDIAAAVNVHPGYLHRIFKRQTGVTVLEYLTSYRIVKAKMLLGKDDVPVGDIADYIGLGSRQYFSAVFKKHTGLTPQQYRSQARTTAGHGAES